MCSIQTRLKNITQLKEHNYPEVKIQICLGADKQTNIGVVLAHHFEKKYRRE